MDSTYDLHSNFWASYPAQDAPKLLLTGSPYAEYVEENLDNMEAHLLAEQPFQVELFDPVEFSNGRFDRNRAFA